LAGSGTKGRHACVVVLQTPGRLATISTVAVRIEPPESLDFGLVVLFGLGMAVSVASRFASSGVVPKHLQIPSQLGQV
jgi:hypothetical protein